MYFSGYTSHSDPLFVCSGILPIKMLYFKLVASLSHSIENHRAPPNISELFTHSEQVCSYSTRFSAAGSFYINRREQIISCFPFPGLPELVTNI